MPTCPPPAAPDAPAALLGPADPPPVRVHAPGAASPFVLVVDHAGRRVPEGLGDMGVGADDWDRHIACDIGIAGVSRALAALLGATVIEQAYSRLVIDCNRRPGHPTSIPARSDGTDVAANQSLFEAGRAARETEVFAPYHAAVTRELDARAAAGRRTALLAMHSFTPVMDGFVRPWHAGVLFNRAPALSLALAPLLRARGYCVGENQPYTLGDESDYTIPVHAERRGLPCLELELRQDLIADPAGQAEWARLLAADLGTVQDQLLEQHAIR